jgi:hypothetical protein
MDNLRYIRDSMERATAFTAVSGWGLVAVGGSALAAALLATAQANTAWWLGVWIGEALLALCIAVVSTSLKGHAAGTSLLSRPGRRVALGFSPAMCAAAALTIALFHAGQCDLLPGMWLLGYGAAVTNAGTFSVRIIPVMGVAFMLAGAAALALPYSLANLSMAAGFGGIHIMFGLIIARRHGG